MRLLSLKTCLAAVIAWRCGVADENVGGTRFEHGAAAGAEVDPLKNPGFGAWPLRQVCTDHGQVAWLGIATQLWVVLEGIMLKGALFMDEANRVTTSVFEANRHLQWGHRTEQICWAGVIALQYWTLHVMYPEVEASAVDAEWKLLAGADWAYLLLSDFPIFGLILMNCCFFFTSPHTRFDLPCPSCDCDQLDEVDSPEFAGFLHFTESLINTVMLDSDPSASVPLGFAGQARPSCPLGHATWVLNQALVKLIHSEAHLVWDSVAGLVRFAQKVVLAWVDPMDNPLAEMLGSRWMVFGVLHALQVQLRRSADGHPTLPVPWLLPGGVAANHLLRDTSSARATFVRYFFANLRTEFWGASNGGAEGVARRLLANAHHEGAAPMAVVDVGASCTKEDCLTLELLRIFGCRSAGASVHIFGLEPNAKNLRRSRTRVKAKLPHRWRLRCATLQRVAASNVTRSGGAPLYGLGGGASLKSAAYGGKAYTAYAGGDVGVRDVAHVEIVPVMRLVDWATRQRPPVQDIAFLKVDVEGMEWEVLQGVEPMLAAQRVGLLMLEYSHFWGAGIASAAARPTLKAVTEHMADRGYDGYFVGSQHLLPISGLYMEWWDRLYEVCEDPDFILHRGIAGWCWFDVVFTLRDSRSAKSAERWVPWALVPGYADVDLPGSGITEGERAKRTAWLKERMRRRGIH